jgi:putative membrane protein
MKPFTRALLIGALSAPLAALAQNPPTDTSKAGGPSKTGDAGKPRPSDASQREKLTDVELQIIAVYHQGNLMEIDLGKLAASRGMNQAVKSYGEMLVRDHSDFDQKLLALAKKTGQQIPAQPALEAEKAKLARAKKSADEIKQLKAAGFDREYMRFMVEDHHHTLADLDRHLAQVKNAELAGMLRDVKPVLQRHHDRAKEVQQKELQAAR